MIYLTQAWDLIGTHSEFIAAIIAGSALIWSARTYRESVSLAHYGELDRMYADLLSLAVNYSHLRQGPNAERKPEEKEQLTAYAYMVWNFIEAVHDRIYDTDSDRKLRDTWWPVIRVEHALFGLWFEDNSGLFKPKLKCFIDDLKTQNKLS